MFLPDDLYVPLGMDIAFQCDNDMVFSFDFNNLPIVYTTCQPNGIMKLHGKAKDWPTCVNRKKECPLILFELGQTAY